MRVLVTGAGGQVGRELVRLGSESALEVVGLLQADLDITDLDAVRRALEDEHLDAVVNAAAYTAVDRAESDLEAATAVNVEGARNVARASADCDVPLVHISTDYVFDGTQSPYAPSDPVAPLGVYGATKAQGEAAVLEVASRSVVLRTAWVFSPYDGNFVTTMLRLAGERDRLRVVADQWGHPTSAADVARAALEAATRSDLPPVLHVAGSPLATWRDLATETVRLGAEAGIVPLVPVDPIATSEYPTPASRPVRVELETEESLRALGIEAIDWRESLRDVIQRRADGVR
ncbi:dTDP-4-dehydrorhamnose reductase [Rubrivirga sp.]|uniref:dTDP-4-dehydrorhamnose reductase n=1 Tax=Rubrivirga sp. TaxID=1885344 RepID=UPI003C714F9B